MLRVFRVYPKTYFPILFARTCRKFSKYNLWLLVLETIQFKFRDIYINQKLSANYFLNDEE